MTSEALKNLKYPIGKFSFPDNVTKEYIDDCIFILEHFPERLEKFIRWTIGYTL